MMQGKENKNHDFETQLFYNKIVELKNLKSRLRRAGEVLQHIEEFNRNFVHKLKNYLTPIKTCSELSLLQLKNEDPLKERLEKILESTERVTDLANGWLLKLHCWLELEAESLHETEGARDMRGPMKIGEEGVGNPTNIEKRRYPRFLANLPLEYCPVSSFTWGSGRTINISNGGLMAVHPEHLEIGLYLLMDLFFPLGHNSRPVKMFGQIVRGNDFGQGQVGYRSGIKLIDISSIGLDGLRNLIMSSNTPEGVRLKRECRTDKD